MKTLFYTLLGWVIAVLWFCTLIYVIWYMSSYMSQAHGILLIVFTFWCIIWYAIIDDKNQDV